MRRIVLPENEQKMRFARRAERGAPQAGTLG